MSENEAIWFQLYRKAKQNDGLLKEICQVLWDAGTGDADADSIREWFKEEFDLGEFKEDEDE